MDKSSERPVASKLYGDEFYRPLVRSFVEDLPSIFNKLSSYINDKNFLRAKELCHQLAGSTATYGYPELANIFHRLENHLTHKDIDTKLVTVHLGEVSQAIKNIQAAIE